MTDGNKSGVRPKNGVAWLYWATYLLAWFAVVWYLIYWTPNPLPKTASLDVFSEERAMEHVRVLSKEIGFRQVSTAGLRRAAEYLEVECTRLAKIARYRADLEAEVAVEQVSGTIVDYAIRKDLINVYHGLTNVMLWIAPKDGRNKPAMLINAHYDSALGSPGAADCASCVGVGLEIIRALIEGNSSFPCPILLLLNGGEETLLQAAHGFMKSSQWKDRAGAFINLESTGSDGSPILFQYTDAWTLQAYASSVRFPRAMILAQELFETRLIPADTDFRMFSKAHHGRLPGVDFATILDATSYHTSRDSFDRLKHGTTQEYGETVLSLMKQMMEMLETYANETSVDHLVYSDIGHLVFMLYSIETAQYLHLTPFLITFFAFVVQSEKGAFMIGASKAMVQNLLSTVLAVLVPTLFAAGRALLSGRLMVWFSNHYAATLNFWPASLLGFLFPMDRHRNPAETSGAFAGISFLLGTAGALLTYLGIGSSILLFVASLSASIASLVTALNTEMPFRGLLLMAIGPSAWLGSHACIAVMHIMEKIGMAGSGRSPYAFLVPDAIIGGLNGLSVAIAFQNISPLFVVHWRSGSKRRVLTALSVWCIVAAVYTSTLSIYSDRHPKRIFLSHLCRQKTDYSCEFIWSTAAWDVVSVSDALPQQLKQLEEIQPDPLDWVIMAPFDRIFRSMTHKAEPFASVGPWGAQHPRLVMTAAGNVSETGKKRLEFELQWERPGWVAMILNGSISDWSLSDASGIKEGKNTVRYSQDISDTVWPFWIEIEGNESVFIQIGVHYPTATSAVEHLAKQFPKWTSVTGGSSFVYQQTFPVV